MIFEMFYLESYDIYNLIDIFKHVNILLCVYLNYLTCFPMVASMLLEHFILNAMLGNLQDI
jgi:hypothetical protein